MKTLKIEDIVTAINSFVITNGRYPSKKEFNINGLPSHATVLRYIGSQSEYVEHGVLPVKTIVHYCKRCNKEIKKGNLFCDKSCAASYNNSIKSKRVKKIVYCKVCQKEAKRHLKQYCSRECYNKLNAPELLPKNINTKKITIHKINSNVSYKFDEKYCINCGEVKAEAAMLYCSLVCHADLSTRQRQFDWINQNQKIKHSKHSIKKFLIKLYGHRCSKCEMSSWNGQPIPLELEHKDGNSENNIPENLCLLCPNCHAQTPTWRNRKQRP